MGEKRENKKFTEEEEAEVEEEYSAAVEDPVVRETSTEVTTEMREVER